MDNLDAWLRKSLDTIKKAHWYRQVKTIASPPGPVIQIQGKTLINFASNDYLGLAHHPQVRAAAIAAIEAQGTGTTGSRLVSGHRSLHDRLETKLAQLKQTEAALVYSSGYLANLGAIAAVVGPRDLILGDAYNHSSLKNGGKLSGATCMDYRHGDLAHLEMLLQSHRSSYRRCLITTDSVFSMDGDLAPLPQIQALAQQYEAVLLVDEAHGTGVLGKNGAGAVAHYGCDRTNLIQVGTLSKALGSLGGYVAGSQTLIEFLKNRSAPWIYTTALSPADTAAAIAAIDLLAQEPQRLTHLTHHREYLQSQLPPSSLFPSDSAILCIKMPSPSQALALSQALQNQGFFVPAIRPPTVPTSRLRLSLMATHTQAQLEQLLHHLRPLLSALNEDPV